MKGGGGGGDIASGTYVAIKEKGNIFYKHSYIHKTKRFLQTQALLCQRRYI